MINAAFIGICYMLKLEQTILRGLYETYENDMYSMFDSCISCM